MSLSLALIYIHEYVRARHPRVRGNGIFIFNFMKKSFILYLDSLTELKKEMSNEELGELFRAILDFENNETVKISKQLKLLFLTFKIQLLRDREHYESICEKRKMAGIKGGRPKKPKKANGFLENQKKQKQASKPDSDSVSV